MLIYSRRAAASGDLTRSEYTEGERESASNGDAFVFGVQEEFIF